MENKKTSWDLDDILSPADKKEIETTFQFAESGKVRRGSWLCNFGYHRWSTWRCVRQGQIIRTSSQALLGHYRDLERICLKCCMIEGKEIKTLCT